MKTMSCGRATAILVTSLMATGVCSAAEVLFKRQLTDGESLVVTRTKDEQRRPDKPDPQFHPVDVHRYHFSTVSFDGKPTKRWEHVVYNDPRARTGIWVDPPTPEVRILDANLDTDALTVIFKEPGHTYAVIVPPGKADRKSDPPKLVLLMRDEIGRQGVLKGAFSGSMADGDLAITLDVSDGPNASFQLIRSPSLTWKRKSSVTDR